MASLTDLIAKQVQAAASNSELGNNVLNSLSDSVLNSLKQTATSANGIQQLTSLFTGKTAAESSAVTQLASQIFSSSASKLGLSSSVASTASSLLPVIIKGLVSVVSSKGAGLDLNSILSTLGAATSNTKAGGLLSAIGTLSKLFKKK